jgi:RNA-directed DNA polymerase
VRTEHTSFTFLGFTFRARGARRKDGTGFTSFLPAVSKDALTRMGAGWQQYYGAFYRSALHGLLSRINAYLLRWIRRKYGRLRPLTTSLCGSRGVQLPRLPGDSRPSAA